MQMPVHAQAQPEGLWARDEVRARFMILWWVNSR